jgi:hypothetical protein
MGWSGMGNGTLLAQASQKFDAFITVDQNVEFQQNLSTLPLAVGLIVAPNNRFETLEPYASTVLRWLSQALPREFVRIEASGKIVPVLQR